MLETLIVISIIVILVGILTTSFVSMNNAKALEGSADVIRSVLSEARSKTVSSEGAERYGVYFDRNENRLVLFKGDSYSVGDEENAEIDLHSRVEMSEVSLSDDSSSVVFKRISGAAEQTGAVVLVSLSDPANTETITIYATGVVE